MYELETYVKVYNIVWFVKEVHVHDEIKFWDNVSHRLYKLGTYRNTESCKEKVRNVMESLQS